MFQAIKNVASVEVGEKFIDIGMHKIVRCEGNYALQGHIALVNVEDEEDMYMLSYKQCHERLRRMELSNIEIRALLCQSMLSFIELMLNVENYKGGKKE